MAKGLPAAFVALVIGGVAAYIAWRQYKAAHAKIKLDLFDKRYAIFEAAWAFLSEPIQSELQGGPRSPFTNMIPRAGFLFGSEVEAYLNEALTNWTELWAIREKAKARGNVIAPEDVTRNTELLNWFHTEASQGLKKVCAPYLDFQNWK
jgi:hypothetical protein